MALVRRTVCLVSFFSPRQLLGPRSPSSVRKRLGGIKFATGGAGRFSAWQQGPGDGSEA